LFDDAVAHHDDLVGERHRLDLVSRHIDGCGLDPLVQLLDFRTHLDTQLGVEVRQRLIEEEDFRIADDCSSHRDMPALATRKLPPRIPVEQRAQFGNACRSSH
jgi:hypothetical protein